MASTERFLECPVCLDPFSSSEKVPKGLQCMHTVCLPCAKQIHKDGQIICPQCRHVHVIADLDKLFTNHNILAMAQDNEKLLNEEEQGVIMKELEEAADIISKCKSVLMKKAASAEDNMVELRASAASAKIEVKKKIQDLIDKLLKRQDELVSQIDSALRELDDSVSKGVQAQLDDAIECQKQYRELLEQDNITDSQVGKFNKLRTAMENHVEKVDDYVVKMMKVYFDEETINKVLDKVGDIGQLDIPRTKKTARPIDYSRLRMIRMFKAQGYDRLTVTDHDHIVVSLSMACNNTSVYNTDGEEMFYIYKLQASDLASGNGGKFFVLDTFVQQHVAVYDKSGHALYSIDLEPEDDGRMAVDNINEHVYIASDDKVKVYNKAGDVLKVFASDLIKSPDAIALNPEQDELYVMDTSENTVIVCNLQGELLRVIDIEGQTGMKCSGGNGLVLDGQGHLVISDDKAHKLHVMDASSGHRLLTIGSEGEGPGEFNMPTGLGFTSTGQLLVCDTGNGRIQIFSM